MFLLWLLLFFMMIRQGTAGFKVATGDSYGEGFARFQQAETADLARRSGRR